MRYLVLAALAACAGPDSVADDPDDFVDGKSDDGTRRVPWSVSRHVFPTDNKFTVARDLGLIAELGAKYVRTDLWWYAVEPTRGTFDTAALAYYRWYVEEARARGLGVVAILSNPPEWAKQVYAAGKRDELAAAFGRYAEQVAVTIGDHVIYYQLWNEPNHAIDQPDGDMDLALFRAGRAGLARGRTTIGTTLPIRTIVNVLVDGHDSPIGPRWEDDIRYYLDRDPKAFDIISIDHYPGTWSYGDWGGNILDRLFALGAKYGKSVAIFEAGYATSHCVLPLNTEDGQLRWVREQLPRMRAKLANPAVTRGVRFELANWFKLDDRNTGNCFDPEDNFGIVRTDRTKKPAFSALAAEIAKF